MVWYLSAGRSRPLAVKLFVQVLSVPSVLQSATLLRLAPVSALLAMLAAGAELPAFAQTVPQVVVTGSRFSAGFDAGNAVGATVITAEDVRNSGATSVFDALRRLGGVHTRSNLAGTSDDTIDLRGFGVTGDQNTLVLIDGQRVSESELQSARLSAIPLNAIERIEILRGNGAVLYGGGATAGVINVITRASSAGQKAFNLYALTGSYNTQEQRAGASVSGESVAVDAAVSRASTHNYRVNNASQQENAVARVRYTGERGEVGLRIVSERQHAQLPGALSTAAYNADPRQAAKPKDYTDTDANHYSLNGNYRFAWGEVALDVFRRDKVNRFYSDDIVGTGGTTFTRSGSSVDGASPRVRVTQPVFGFDNQLVAGYDASRWAYRRQVSFQFNSYATEADLGNGNLTNDETGKQYNRAWYAKDDIKLGAVRLSIGARRENLRQFTRDPITPLPQTAVERNLHAEDVAAAWAINGNWTVHARTGNSYRIGNIDENRFRFPSPGFLLPQTSKDKEAGLSYNQRAYDVDVKVFEHRINNEIMCLANLNAGFCNNINLPPTRRDGFELTGKWRPLAALDFTAFYTQVRARFASGFAGNFSVAGKEVPVVPRSRASLQANWRPTAQDSVNAGWQYTGSQIYDNDHANVFGSRIPAFSTLDAKYARRVGQFELAVTGTNLLNKNYFSYGVTGSGRANVYPERRRALFVSLEAKF